MTLKYGDMTTIYYYIWIRDVINLICFVYFGIFAQSTAYGVGNFLMYKLCSIFLNTENVNTNCWN